MTHPHPRLDPTLAPLLLLHEIELYAASNRYDGNTHTVRAAEAWCAAERERLRAKMLPQAATQTDGRG